jgi:hypothetical protein
MARFTEARKRDDLPCRLELYENQVEFSVLESDRHFWSPFLNLLVEQVGDDGTCLRGKYGPNVNVWSMFLAAYAATGLAGTGGLIIGLSQYQLGQSATGLLLAAACGLAAIVIYGIGRIGRSLAHPQMIVFHEFLEELFDDVIVHLEDEERRIEKPPEQDSGGQ